MPQGRFHQDQSGTKFNMLTLLYPTEIKSKNGSYRYMTRCECGNEKVICFSQIKGNRSKSCGCLQLRKGKDAPAYKHGRSRTKDYEFELHVKNNYGLSFSEYTEMLKKQNDLCKICSSPPPKHRKKRLNIDHCHKTGRVRGLLCDSCNRALGLFKDDPNLLSNAVKYLT